MSLLLLLSVAALASPPGPVAPKLVVDQPSAVQVSGARGAHADSLSELVRGLKQLVGEFVRRGTRVPTYEFTGDRASLEAFAAFGDSAVIRLADCLDNREPAAAVAEAKTVTVGAMCYLALTTIASHEITDRRGDIRGGWPGTVLSPLASAARMRAAKRAWLAAIRSHAYVLN